MTSTPQESMSAITLQPPRRRARRWWWIVVAVVAVAGTALGVVKVVQRRQERRRTEERLMTYTVERGDLHITVTASGTLKAKNSKHLWADIQGRAKVAWLVDEGTSVDSGDVLVQMETEDLEKSIADGQIELQQAVAARIQAEEKLDIQKRQNTSDIQAAQVKLNIALLELQRYEEGEVPKLRREAKLNLDRAKVDLRLAEEDLVGMDEYVAKGYFTKRDFEQRKLALREATDAVQTAEQALDLLRRFEIPKELAQKRSDVEQARTNLDLAQRKAKSELAQKEADLEQRQFVESLRRDRLRERQETLEKMIIRAPSPGFVIYGDDRRWWSRRDIQVGMDVWRGRVILTLPDLSEMEVMVSVNEVDLDKIQEGRPATITLDAYPALSFRGHVRKVGKLAERQSRWRSSEVSTFEVIVAIAMEDARRTLTDVLQKRGDNGQLRPGMSAKAEIDIATFTDVTYVPVDAVYEMGGEHGCYVMEDGGPVWRAVEIGLNNRTHVHIKKGLTPGEAVLRYDPSLVSAEREPTTRPARRRPTTRPATRPTTRPGGPRRSGRPPGDGAGQTGGRGG